MTTLVYVIAIVAIHLVDSDNVLVAKRKGAQKCEDGCAFNQLYPDRLRYTCKAGPGRFVKCTKYLRYNKIPFSCPNFGYYSGWYSVGPHMFVVRCCTEKGLHYSLKDCQVNPDDSSKRGEIYQVTKGKVIIGSQFVRGRWVRMECGYSKYNKYNK